MARYWIILGLITAASPAAADSDVVFQRDVLPILRERCHDCHSGDVQESGLRLDSMKTALAGGDSGSPAIVPGNSGQSYLIELVTSDDEDLRMPPDGDPLTPNQIDLLRRWIDHQPAWQTARNEISRDTVSLWSLQPLTRPTPPSVVQADESDHPIDAFVSRKLAEQGLAFSPRAERRRLIRRLFLVMHGLPPTPEQVEAFVEDRRDDAWEILVETVLASPRYGERMATHWLDLVRFGETHGFETNRERPNAWHYRDWVIEAFNRDKPYDEFVLQQIAGDAVGEDRGTGFLVAGPYDLVKGQDPKLGLIQRQDELADMVNTTGTAFLGLTVGCARCHNHKFDPITQTDYYAMQAVFAGVNHADRKLLSHQARPRIAGLRQAETQRREQLERFIPTRPPHQRPAVSPLANNESFDPVPARFVRMTINATNGSAQPCIDELEVFADGRNVALASAGAVASSSGDFVHPLHKLSQINDGEYGNAKSWIASLAEGGWVQIELPKKEPISEIVWSRDRRGQYQDRLASDYVIEVSLDAVNWSVVADSSDRQTLSSNRPDRPAYDFDAFPPAEAEQGREWLAELKRWESERIELEQGTLIYAGTFSEPPPTFRLHRGEIGAEREQVAPDAVAAIGELGLNVDTPEQQRRLSLARWIIAAENPLPARVMVNRLWQFHFGTGIVDTPSDFGRNGTAPTHPELLDWLASELIAGGWSLKQMQRLILTSKTWRQDSRPVVNSIKIDAGSRWLWRFPPRRLEAEGIRDCILAVTGKLDLTVGGPGFSGFEVEMENVRHYHPKQDYGPEDWRRMIYMTKVRQERDAVFGVFDCPDGSQVTPQRSRSTTPLQALNLFNSRFVKEQAGFLADRLMLQTESTAKRVCHAYELCFGRLPDDTEIEAAKRFIGRHGLPAFARAMLNANEMVFIP